MNGIPTIVQILVGLAGGVFFFVMNRDAIPLLFDTPLMGYGANFLASLLFAGLVFIAARLGGGDGAGGDGGGG